MAGGEGSYLYKGLQFWSLHIFDKPAVQISRVADVNDVTAEPSQEDQDVLYPVQDPFPARGGYWR